MKPVKIKTPTRVIKKENNKYIDSKSNECITLDALKLLVENHEDFSVVDSSTLQDKTRETLIKIVVQIELITSTPWTTKRLIEIIKMLHSESKTETKFNLKSKATGKSDPIKLD
jgi:polyhydroxyalkanoate synthesis regulator protein